jgi:hypothetical protein
MSNAEESSQRCLSVGHTAMDLQLSKIDQPQPSHNQVLSCEGLLQERAFWL